MRQLISMAAATSLIGAVIALAPIPSTAQAPGGNPDDSRAQGLEQKEAVGSPVEAVYRQMDRINRLPLEDRGRAMVRFINSLPQTVRGQAINYLRLGLAEVLIDTGSGSSPSRGLQRVNENSTASLGAAAAPQVDRPSPIVENTANGDLKPSSDGHEVIPAPKSDNADVPPSDHPERRNNSSGTELAGRTLSIYQASDGWKFNPQTSLYENPEATFDLNTNTWVHETRVPDILSCCDETGLWFPADAEGVEGDYAFTGGDPEQGRDKRGPQGAPSARTDRSGEPSAEQSTSERRISGCSTRSPDFAVQPETTRQDCGTKEGAAQEEVNRRVGGVLASIPVGPSTNVLQRVAMTTDGAWNYLNGVSYRYVYSGGYLQFQKASFAARGATAVRTLPGSAPSGLARTAPKGPGLSPTGPGARVIVPRSATRFSSLSGVHSTQFNNPTIRIGSGFRHVNTHVSSLGGVVPRGAFVPRGGVVPSIKTNVPHVHVPSVRAPSIHVATPTIRVPSVNIHTPNVKVPNVRVPNVRVPTVRVPTVTVH